MLSWRGWFCNSSGTTILWTICVWSFGLLMMCVRNVFATALRASVFGTEIVRCGLPTAPRASVPRVVRVSLQKSHEVDMAFVDDAVACGVTQKQTCWCTLRACEV